MATQRGYYRSELMRALNNLLMALTHLARVGEAYVNDHPEVSTPLEQVMEGISLSMEVIQKIYDSI